MQKLTFFQAYIYMSLGAELNFPCFTQKYLLNAHSSSQLPLRFPGVGHGDMRSSF